MKWNQPFGLLRHLERIELVQLLKQAAICWYEGDTFTLGAALAYYAAFSIAPLLLLTLEVASLVFGKDAAQGRLVEQFKTTFGPTVAQALASTLAYTYQSGTGVAATIFGVILLLFAATGVFGQLQQALNNIWGVKPRPGRGILGVVKDRLWSFVMVVIVGALLLALMGVSAALSAIGQFIDPAHIPRSLHVWHALHLGVSFVFITVLSTLIYQVLPDMQLSWRDVWVGGALTALLFLLGNYLISLYLSESDVASAYGAAGSFAVLLLWVYYSSQALMFGAEFTQVYARRSGKAIEPAENAVSVAVEHQDGQVLSHVEAAHRPAQR
jgi:membrane protein